MPCSFKIRCIVWKSRSNGRTLNFLNIKTPADRIGQRMQSRGVDRPRMPNWLNPSLARTWPDRTCMVIISGSNNDPDNDLELKPRRLGLFSAGTMRVPVLCFFPYFCKIHCICSYVSISNFYTRSWFRSVADLGFLHGMCWTKIFISKPVKTAYNSVK